MNQQVVGLKEESAMGSAVNRDEDESVEFVVIKPDIEVYPTTKPDIEVIPDYDSGDELEIGSGLSLRFDRQYFEETYEELEVLRQSPWQTRIRQRLAESFGPEMTAGVVIGLLVATFALLMVVGVSEQPTVQDEPVNPAVAPPAEISSEDIPAVEIGEAVTIERE